MEYLLMMELDISPLNREVAELLCTASVTVCVADIGGTDGNNAADDQNTENNIQSEHSGLWEESGRQSQTGSRLTRSRPSSTLGSRPSSSIRRLRKEPTNRKRTGVDLEVSHM